MNTTEQNQARSEYFATLLDLMNRYFMSPVLSKGDRKEAILSVTYDANVALQKHVEELEAAIVPLLKELKFETNFNKMNGRGNDWSSYVQAIEQLLTKQS